MMKRLLDCVFAGLGLLFLWPLMALAMVLIRLESPGPLFFCQERIGLAFRPFRIYKFRTMVQDAAARGGVLTRDGDTRITKVGRLLRRTKCDELPQLINVLKGDMSIVGPRPEVKEYVDLFHADYIEILSVKPGITDLASLRFRNESAILGRSRNPESTYITEILPAKIRLSKTYIKKSGWVLDMMLIARTMVSLIGR